MVWPYTKHVEGLISVTIDNNCWDYLFDNSVDLTNEFPRPHFALFVTREIEIESDAIPASKPQLRSYVRHSIEKAGIETSSIFGFDTGEVPRRRGNFGAGTFMSTREAEIYKALGKFTRSKQVNSGLCKYEGDISLAVASFFLSC